MTNVDSLLTELKHTFQLFYDAEKLNEDKNTLFDYLKTCFTKLPSFSTELLLQRLHDKQTELVKELIQRLESSLEEKTNYEFFSMTVAHHLQLVLESYRFFRKTLDMKNIHDIRDQQFQEKINYFIKKLTQNSPNFSEICQSS